LKSIIALFRLLGRRRSWPKRPGLKICDGTALDNAGNQAISPAMVETFARAARQRIRLEGGGYRRDHLRALAQRVEVADREVRIMGSKSELLRTLVAASIGKSGVIGVQSSVLKWRARKDSNL
jgi:site-specific DNA recombinase